MYDLFMNWMGSVPSSVTDDMAFMFVCVASLVVLKFLLDIIKYFMYYIGRR